jgi:hypothetical protein
MTVSPRAGPAWQDQAFIGIIILEADGADTGMLHQLRKRADILIFAVLRAGARKIGKRDIAAAAECGCQLPVMARIRLVGKHDVVDLLLRLRSRDCIDQFSVTATRPGPAVRLRPTDFSSMPTRTMSPLAGRSLI